MVAHAYMTDENVQARALTSKLGGFEFGRHLSPDGTDFPMAPNDVRLPAT